MTYKSCDHVTSYTLTYWFFCSISYDGAALKQLRVGHINVTICHCWSISDYDKVLFFVVGCGTCAIFVNYGGGSSKLFAFWHLRQIVPLTNGNSTWSTSGGKSSSIYCTFIETLCTTFMCIFVTPLLDSSSAAQSKCKEIQMRWRIACRTKWAVGFTA